MWFLLYQDEYQSFSDNKVVIDEGKNLGSRQLVSKKTCKGLCSGTNGCNSFVHCEMEQKDVSGTKILVGDCKLKDKVLTGSEETRDGSNGNKCTTTYKKLFGTPIFLIWLVIVSTLATMI